MDESMVKQAVSDLVARYADYCDQHDWDAVVDLFTADAVFDAESVYGRTMTGPVELMDFFTSAPAAVGHHPTSVYCTEVGETAAASRMKMLVVFRSGLFSVDYAWDVVLVDGQWRIAHQTIALVGKVSLPKVDKAAASA